MNRQEIEKRLKEMSDEDLKDCVKSSWSDFAWAHNTAECTMCDGWEDVCRYGNPCQWYYASDDELKKRKLSL